ncbi:tautomerase family protein [Egibacter rhizosphaerae]|uniref:tautomerase family protein n=1 Tax=Egibacter rhizosphaerae TaxID=1670831 RepID=UPI0013F15AB4
MPLVEISVSEGRDEQQLRQLTRTTHEAVTSSLGVRDESVRVIVREVPPTLWSAGGRPWRSGASEAEPAGHLSARQPIQARLARTTSRRDVLVTSSPHHPP